MALANLQVVADALATHGEVGALDRAFVLMTVDDEGFPFACLLSSRQLAVREQRLVALVQSKRTTANVQRDGRATLHVIHEGASVLARLQMTSLRALEAKALLYFDVMLIESERRTTILTPVMYQLDQAILDYEGPSVAEVIETTEQP